MINELQRIRQSKLLLEKEGNNNFFKYLGGIITLEFLALGLTTIFGVLNISTFLFVLMSIIVVTYEAFDKIYKRFLMVGYSKISSEHEYYE